MEHMAWKGRIKPGRCPLERVHEGHSGTGNGPRDRRTAQAGAGVPAELSGSLL